MYSSPRFGLYGSIPWIGPLRRFARGRCCRTGVFFAGARFLLAERDPEGREDFGFAVDGFLAADFFPAFLLVGAFFLAATFFLLEVFFRAAVFRCAALFDAFFFGVGFFFFAAAGFFLVTLRLLDAGFRAAAFRLAAFLFEAVAFFRFLLAVFFAGIFNSCRTEKRPGLYMAWTRREARFFQCFRSSAAPLSFCRDNRFMRPFPLHYRHLWGTLARPSPDATQQNQARGL
jgi:hypothetical protein